MITTVSSTATLDVALKAAKAGDTILLNPGAYSLTAAKLSFTSDVTIASADVTRPATVTNLDLNTVKGLTFRDLEFRADAANGHHPFKVVNSTDVHFERLYVHGSLDSDPGNDVYAFFVRNSTDVSFDDSEFEQLLAGIAHLDSNGLRISNNEFHDIRGDGVRGGGSSNVTIDGNTFRDFYPAAGDHPDAIQFWTTNTTTYARNIVITNNSFIRGDGAPVQGVFMNDEAGNRPYDTVTISGNLVAGGMYHGITIVHGRNVSIMDNVIQGFSDMKSWILLDGVEVASVVGNVSNELLVKNSTGVVNLANERVALATDGGAWAHDTWLNALDETAQGGGLTLMGTSGANTLTGGLGADTLTGAGGADVLAGGAGDDVYVTDNLDKIIEAASGGIDTIQSGLVVVMPNYVENVELTGGNSVGVTGNTLSNVITGNAGGNYIKGGAGTDTLYGGAGKDVLAGGAGNDVLYGGDQADTFLFVKGDGRDTIRDFAAGDSIEVLALLNAGSTAKLAQIAAGVSITFTTGEYILVQGAALSNLHATSTGWVF